MKNEWLVWSMEHNAWWKPCGIGYCLKKAEAGRFTFKEALDIVRDANTGLGDEPHEAMILDD